VANTKISALASGDPAQNGDLIPVDRAGANFSLTAQSVAALAAPWSASTGQTPGTSKQFTFFPHSDAPLNDTFDMANLGVGYAWVIPVTYSGPSITATRIAARIYCTIAACNVYVGIYDSTGALVTYGKFAAVNAGYQSITVTVSAFTIVPGFYYITFGTDTAGLGAGQCLIVGDVTAQRNALIGSLGTVGYRSLQIVAGAMAISCTSVGSFSADASTLSRTPQLMLLP
jgi:ethanolamine utilization microcompartment shell protein EutS